MASMIELLKSDECLVVIALSCAKDDQKVEKFSLFERFEYICEHFADLADTEFGKAFLRMLSNALEREISAEVLAEREIVKSLWRAVFGGEKFDSSLLLIAKKEKADLKSAWCEIFEDGSTEVFDFLSSHGGELEDISCDLSKKESVRMDLSDFSYFRPDEYRSSLAYSKLLRDENLSEEESAILVLWVLCRTLMKRQLKVRVRVGGNIDTLRSVLDLLEQRKLHPDILLEITEETPREIVPLITHAKHKNLYVELSKNVSEWFSQLPATRIRIKEKGSC